MENYREAGKVKHRIISNLSKWSEEMILGLEKLLKEQKIFSIRNTNQPIKELFCMM